MAAVSCLSCYIILFFHWRVWYTRLNKSYSKEVLLCIWRKKPTGMAAQEQTP